MAVRLQHVPDDVLLDRALVGLAQLVRVHHAVAHHAHDAERRGVEAGLDVPGAVVERDRELLHADLEIVGDRREQPLLVREDQAVGGGRIEAHGSAPTRRLREEALDLGPARVDVAPPELDQPAAERSVEK